MNELGTITQDFTHTPFLDSNARSHAKYNNSAAYRAKRKAYREERLCGTFSPKECWKRCIGSDERRDG